MISFMSTIEYREHDVSDTKKRATEWTGGLGLVK